MARNRQLTGHTCPVFLSLALLASSVIPGPKTAQAAGLPVTTLTIGQQDVRAEVAANDPTREHGLMGRKSLPGNHGMLFVFDSAAPQCFWMKDTPLPLSIAFIQADGTILSIDDMQPFSEAVHCPPGPIVYALEMRQGWFRHAGIVAGEAVKGLPGKSAR